MDRSLSRHPFEATGAQDEVNGLGTLPTQDTHTKTIESMQRYHVAFVKLPSSTLEHASLYKDAEQNFGTK